MSIEASLQSKPGRNTLLLFILLSSACMLFSFKGAFSGRAILAPIDIPAAIYPKFKYIAPESGPVPGNQYLIDMFDLVTPRQYIAHEAIQRGEFPWWDPYTDGGRPLAVEGHANLTDPIRLALCLFLPFAASNNWTHILHSFLAGLSMFLFLRYLGFSQFVTLLGALSFQFSGLQAIFFYPEFAPNTVWYYPLFWIVLIKHYRTRPFLGVALGSLLITGAIWGGSQQSHGWLVAFLGCLTLGYGLQGRAHFVRLAIVTGSAFFLGCLISAPILLPQVEVFMLSDRHIESLQVGRYLLTGVLSLTGLFPWLLGSFRTIDLSKLVDQASIPNVIFLGTPLMALAVVGLFSLNKQKLGRSQELVTAALLVAVYFVLICSTPLLNTFYVRSAGIAIMGLIILFGYGLESLLNDPQGISKKILQRIVILLTVAIMAVHLFAFLIYPRVERKIQEMVLARDLNNGSMPSVPELRRFQVKNLAHEITFENPEVLLSFCGCLLLLWWASGPRTFRPLLLAGVFAGNLLPLVLFFARYIPNSPIQQWEALLAGGPEQQKIMRAAGRDGRYIEAADTRIDHALPGAASCYYKIHSLNGFTAFHLLGPGQTSSPRKTNIRYTSTGKTPAGALEVTDPSQVRFVWAQPQQREVAIVSETLNTIRLHIEGGPPGSLVRTDTYYPGWNVETPQSISQSRNAEGFLTYAIPAEATELVLRFEHTHASATKAASFFGCASLGILLLFARSKRLADPLQPRPEAT